MPYFHTITLLHIEDSCDGFFILPCSNNDAEPKHITVLITEVVGFRTYTSLGTKPSTPAPLACLLINCSMNQLSMSTLTFGFYITSCYLYPVNKRETKVSHYCCFSRPSQAFCFPKALHWLLSPSLEFSPHMKFLFLGGISSHSTFLLRSWLVPQTIYCVTDACHDQQCNDGHLFTL